MKRLSLIRKSLKRGKETLRTGRRDWLGCGRLGTYYPGDKKKHVGERGYGSNLRKGQEKKF